MTDRAVTYFCTVVLVWALCVPPCLAGTNEPNTKPTIQDKVAQLPAGTVVVVKMRTKRTITGRLGPISSDGFELQYAAGSSVHTETIPFASVKSVKQKQQGMSTGAKIAIGFGLAAAAFVLTGVILCATGGCYN